MYKEVHFRISKFDTMLLPFDEVHVVYHQKTLFLTSILVKIGMCLRSCEAKNSEVLLFSTLLCFLFSCHIHGIVWHWCTQLRRKPCHKVAALCEMHLNRCTCLSTYASAVLEQRICAHLSEWTSIRTFLERKKKKKNSAMKELLKAPVYCL